MSLQSLVSLIIATLLVSSLSGCTKEVVRVPYMVDDRIPIAPDAKPMILKKVHWYAVSDKNMIVFKARYLKKNQLFAFVALSPQDYENLSSNVGEMKRYIQDLQAQVQYYKNSINKRVELKEKKEQDKK